MKRIPLTEACQLLDDSSAVILGELEGCPVLYVQTTEPDDREDGVFLSFEITDGDGLVYQFAFEEKHNAEVLIEGATMLLKEADGEETVFTLLAPPVGRLRASSRSAG